MLKSPSLPNKRLNSSAGVNDERKTKAQLITELADLRRRVSQLETAEAERQRAEEALAQERDLLRALLDNLPDRIYFKDLESRFTYINLALVRYLGLSDPAEALGKTDFDFFSAEHARQARADEEAIIRTGEPLISKDEKETRPDGRMLWVSSTKMPLRNRAGQIIGTFGLSRDINDRKQAEEALR